MVDIAEMRAYVRGDADMPSEELALLEACMEAAIEWFANAGVPERENSPLYDLGVKMLAASWFLTRGNDTGVQMHTVPQGVYAIKHQLAKVPTASSQEGGG